MADRVELHSNIALMQSLVLAVSEKSGISQGFIEKDYWVTHILALLSKSEYVDVAIFKGGTSLSKAHRIVPRFSEDVDLALCSNEGMSSNSIKSMIRSIEKRITVDLQEVVRSGTTSKGSRFRKSLYEYDSIVGSGQVPQKGNIIVEINSFANPYPFVKMEVESFITAFLRESERFDFIKEYGLEPFHINVLDKRQTLIEKIVSLVRFSHLGVEGLKSKIRHFYDIHSLVQDAECRDYIESPAFATDFHGVLSHDKEMFEEPAGWQQTPRCELPLFCYTEELWSALSPTYKRELTQLSFAPIPPEDEVLKSVKVVFERLK